MRLRSAVRTGGCQARGQTLVEFALVFPIFMLTLFAVIIFGLGVFYNQQIASAARDAARYAATHSSTAVCPTASTIDPNAFAPLAPQSYFACDRPADSWPRMTAAAKSNLWAIPPSAVSLVGCWSGFETPAGTPNALPQAPNTFVDCTMRAVDGSQVRPQADPGLLACPIAAGQVVDTSSDLAYYAGTHYPTTVTVYVCFNWHPPMGGLLFLPSTVTLRGVATEVLQRQQ